MPGISPGTLIAREPFPLAVYTPRKHFAKGIRTVARQTRATWLNNGAAFQDSSFPVTALLILRLRELPGEFQRPPFALGESSLGNFNARTLVEFENLRLVGEE